MIPPTISPVPCQAPSAFTWRGILSNLIRQEWRLCRGAIIPLAVVWLIGLWVLVIFHHPAWLLAIGIWHVMLITPAQAGRDVIDGTEEFSFSLPPGRSPLYLARLAPGLVFLTANGLLGGHFAYLRKEAAGSGGAVGRVGGSGMFWIIAVIVGLLIFMMMSFWLMRATVVEQHGAEEIRALMQAEEIRAKAPGDSARDGGGRHGARHLLPHRCRRGQHSRDRRQPEQPGVAAAVRRRSGRGMSRMDRESPDSPAKEACGKRA